MHYANLHGFGLPSAPIQRHDSQGIPIDQWYFPVPGLAGHYLYSNGDISHSFDSNLTNRGFDWIYTTIESAFDAMKLYNEKAKAEIVQASQTLHDTIVHKLLEPQIISDTFLLWEIISADDPSFALSDSNTIVNVAYKAHFETFQQALFAKLRYERTHREIKTN